MKAGIIGVGRMGRRHIEAVRRAGLQLSGVFDVDQGSLQSARDEQSLADELLFSDLEEFYARARPECLVIATTADSHCALTCMAAERGVKYVLVEKPMAVSLEECDRMIAACRGNGTRLAVNHPMRFMEQYTEAKRLLHTPEYGGLTSMTVVAGNIGFAMNASHFFEGFRFLAGEPLVEVSAWFSPGSVSNPRGAQFEDRAGSIRAVSASGKRLYIEIGADQGHGVCTVYACRYGMICVDEMSGDWVSSVREGQFRDLPTTRYAMPAVQSRRALAPREAVGPSAAALNALLEGLNSVSGEDGRMVVELLVAAYRSAECGGATVKMDGGLDRGRVFPWA